MRCGRNNYNWRYAITQFAIEKTGIRIEASAEREALIKDATN
jgi:hypothetical protein